MLIPLVLSFLVASAPIQQSNPDKLLATRHLRGQVVGFEVGDFQHVIIRERNHKQDSYFIGEYGLQYYLAVFAHKQGTFTIQKVDSYIEEAGGREIIERVNDAKIAGTSFGSWWKKQRKHYKNNDQAVDDHFQPIVDKLTRKNG